MDIKEIIASIESKIEDKAFQAELKKDPIKAVENLLGINLPDEQVKAVMDFVKTKVNLDNISGIVKGVEGKLDGEKDGVKGILKDAGDMIGGLFGKKD